MASVSLTSFPAVENAYCPKCGSAIKLHDPKGSEFCVCSSCYAYIQFEGDQPKFLKTLKKPALQPTIPLGAVGVLNHIPFKMIAYLEKDEYDAKYAWREYLLYNYETGYAALSEYDGHWNLIFGKNFQPKLESPLDGKDYVMCDNIDHKLFHKYGADVKALVGEFDWDVYNEDVFVSEFVAPPFIISKEESKSSNNKNEINYYRGEYMEPQVVAEAFKLDVGLFPSQVGILSNQPSKARENWTWSIRVSVLLLLVLLAIEMVIVLVKPSDVLMDSVYNLTYTPEKGINEFQPIKSSTFKVSDASSALNIELSSGLDNNWLEATIVLVNDQTNQTWEVTKGIEYYSGYEGGERWSEGSKSGDILLSEIPSGTYHLNIYPASGDATRDFINIKIESNGTIWRNMLVCGGLLFLLPIINMFRMSNFEKRRWANSDYSPFHE